MKINRRHFLMFIGATAGSIASDWYPQQFGSAVARAKTTIQTATNFGSQFRSVKVPIPLAVDNLTIAQQLEQYANYEVKDDLVLPEGFTYDLIAAWGDRVGDSRFGYNNDYLSLIETAPNEGYLAVNFEYISGGTWMQTYSTVIGKELPFAELIAAAEADEGIIDGFSLEDGELKTKIAAVSQEGLIDLGIGVISVRRNADGKWERTYSAADRRITGISGLNNPKRTLKSTGAAVAIFTKPNKLGYEDNLGDRIIGTFQNCAGGTTPWGTVLSAEENFQSQVPEPVMADGSAFPPSAMPFAIADEDINGCANIFGLAGNKYGWMVEVDPANPNDYGTKHTWLGRYRHEAFGIRAEVGKNLAVYSGCDRRGGHLYKFVSSQKVFDPKDKSNSRLFESGILYGAKLNPDGTGKWIPLSPSTAIDPVLPSQVVGEMVMLPESDRVRGGVMEVSTEEQLQPLIERYQTLEDLYRGNSYRETQGAILIDAHYAASAVGVTCTARPEDTIINDEGTLFIAFTSGSAGSDGGPDKTIFVAPDGASDYEYGWIMKLSEDDRDPASLSFTWSMLATGGEVAKGGDGFANPDNLTLDREGNLWMVTDMSTSKQNNAVPRRTKDGATLSDEELTGVFGNNALWYIPLKGEKAGQVYPFAIGPMECECTGLTFNADNSNLFLSIQHPGETNGIRRNMAEETREFQLLATDGTTFNQQRRVPIGSNWPSGATDSPPVPGVVVIRQIEVGTPQRLDG